VVGVQDIQGGISLCQQHQLLTELLPAHFKTAVHVVSVGL